VLLWQRRLITGASAAAFALAPIAAQAGTRAGDSGTRYLAIVSHPARTLPEARPVELVEHRNTRHWLWLTGSGALLLLLSALKSSSQDRQNHRSNGAN